MINILGAGAVLRRIRTGRGFSQNSVEIACGWSIGRLSRWESNERGIKSIDLIVLAGYYNIELSTMIQSCLIEADDPVCSILVMGLNQLGVSNDGI